jgi:uncharacterized protein (DUF697 family)
MIAEAAGTTGTDELATAQDKAVAAISTSVKWAAAASMIPLPYVDMLGLAAVQLSMVKDIADAYGQPAKSEVIRGLIASMLGTLTPVAASSVLVGSSLKLIPGAGSLLGSVSVAAFGAAATYAVGKSFVKHFEKGGSLDNFNPESIKEDLKKDFAKGKKDAS